MSLDARFRHIVFEGPIGVGKTSLAKKVALLNNAQTLLEAPQDNPFLENFYRDAARYALPCQLFFLFQRVNQLRDLAQADFFTRPTIGDFLLDKDPIFASLTLSEEEHKLYQQIYATLKPQAPAPDLVVYLQAQPETLAQRVQQRGHLIETVISEQYLYRLADSYQRFFHDYAATPLLIVNTENINPLARDDHFELLLHKINNLRGKREFFNLAE